MDLFHDVASGSYINWHGATLFFGVFVAGLLGSLHCIGMCGPLASLFSINKISLISYQIGRLVSYCSVGSLAGFTGQQILGVLRNTLNHQVAVSIYGGILLVLGGIALFQSKPLTNMIHKTAYSIQAHFIKSSVLVAHSKHVAGFAFGLITVFLPCGQLHIAMIGAAATQSAGYGTLFMFLFWLGTTPLLSVGIFGVRKFFGTAAIPVQRFIGALMICLGFISFIKFAQNIENARANTSTKNGSSICP